jgi:hypothetical protein
MRGRHPHVDHRDVRLAPPNRVAKLFGVHALGQYVEAALGENSRQAFAQKR